MPKRKKSSNNTKPAPVSAVEVVMDEDEIPRFQERTSKAKCSDGKHAYTGPPHPTIPHGVHPDAKCTGCGRRFGG